MIVACDGATSATTNVESAAPIGGESARKKQKSEKAVSKWPVEHVEPVPSLLAEALHEDSPVVDQSKWQTSSPVVPLPVQVEENEAVVARSPRGVKLRDGQIDFPAFESSVKKL